MWSFVKQRNGEQEHEITNQNPRAADKGRTETQGFIFTFTIVLAVTLKVITCFPDFLKFNATFTLLPMTQLKILKILLTYLKYFLTYIPPFQCLVFAALCNYIISIYSSPPPAIYSFILFHTPAFHLRLVSSCLQSALQCFFQCRSDRMNFLTLCLSENVFMLPLSLGGIFTGYSTGFQAEIFFQHLKGIIQLSLVFVSLFLLFLSLVTLNIFFLHVRL